jgi:hypothetical protein
MLKCWFDGLLVRDPFFRVVDADEPERFFWCFPYIFSYGSRDFDQLRWSFHAC